MIIALSKSWSTPDTISLAEADLLFIKTAIGISEGIIGLLLDSQVLIDLGVFPICFKSKFPLSVRLSKIFIAELNKTQIKYLINGSPRLHGFINITFNHCDGQTLLMNLDLNGIAISPSDEAGRLDPLTRKDVLRTSSPIAIPVGEVTVTRN